MNPIALFQGPQAGAAAVLAVLCLALGAIATCLVCKLTHGACGKGKCDAKAQNARRTERPRDDKPRHQPPSDGSVEIYVGNLSYDLTEDVLRKEFEAYGKVNAVRIVTTHYNGKSKGYGFVNMPVRAEAEAAIAALNDKEILGRKLRCNEAHT